MDGLALWNCQLLSETRIVVSLMLLIDWLFLNFNPASRPPDCAFDWKRDSPTFSFRGVMPLTTPLPALSRNFHIQNHGPGRRPIARYAEIPASLWLLSAHRKKNPASVLTASLHRSAHASLPRSVHALFSALLNTGLKTARSKRAPTLRLIQD